MPLIANFERFMFTLKEGNFVLQCRNIVRAISNALNPGLFWCHIRNWMNTTKKNCKIIERTRERERWGRKKKIKSKRKIIGCDIQVEMVELLLVSCCWTLPLNCTELNWYDWLWWQETMPFKTHIKSFTKAFENNTLNRREEKWFMRDDSGKDVS